MSIRSSGYRSVEAAPCLRPGRVPPLRETALPTLNHDSLPVEASRLVVRTATPHRHLTVAQGPIRHPNPTVDPRHTHSR